MNAETDRQVGRNVATVRQSKGLTQDDLAAKVQLRGNMNISRTTIAKIETGRRHLYADEIIDIKEILDCEFDDLFYGQKDSDE